MGHRHDYTALDWVHKELGETLNQAQLALAAFEEDNSDVTRLQFCLNYLHQVRGTLDMVEVYGAALLASELEKLAAFLVSRPERATNDSLSVLLQGILQLPTYLERLMHGDSDQPLILAPLLNDLRAQRDANSLAAAKLFAPDLRHEQARLAEPFPIEKMADDVVPRLQKLHQLYQLSLLNLLRDHQPEEALNYLCKSTHRIASEYGDCGLGLFWSIATTLLDAVRQQQLDISQDLLRLFSQLDRTWRQQLRQLKRQHVPQIDHSVLTSMLYFVGQANAEHAAAASLQERFVLSEALLTEQQVSTRRQQMQGPDTHTVDSVARVLVDELATVKEQLDLLVRAPDRQPTQLHALVAPLQQISDTMDLLQIKQARRVLDEQIQHLDNLSHQAELDDDSLMDIAGGLLYVEATLSGLAQSGMDDEQFDSLDNELSNAHIALIREVRNSIETCKEAIVEYLGTQWDSDKLQAVPSELQQIRANLNIIPLPNAATVADGIQTYVESTLLTTNYVPEWQDMDRLADALVGIDYYLERLPRDRGEDGNEAILQRAADSLAELGYPVTLSGGQYTAPPANNAVSQALDDYFGFIDQIDEADIDAAIAASAEYEETSEFAVDTEAGEPTEDLESVVEPAGPTHSWPEYRAMDLDALDAIETVTDEPSTDHLANADNTARSTQEDNDDDLIDDDIREIFLEEAADVQAEITTWFPQYCADPDNIKALGELRRAFHTLKGSGRMVRAMVIGELGWSIENLLNHRRDGVIPHSDALIALITDVNEILPQLVDDFAQNAPSDTNAVDQLHERAKAIMSGDHDAIEPYDDGLDAFMADDDDISDTTTENSDLASKAAEETGRDDDSEKARLFHIFSHEIHNHLTTIEEFLRANAGDPEASVTDALQRALHTIKGSSHMAGIEAMANLASPVEHLVKSLQVYRLPATLAVQQLLQDTVAIASEQLNAASKKGDISAAPGSFFDQIKDINAWVADSAAAAGSESSSSLMSIFLNEAMNTVLDAEDTLKAWQESGLESHRVIALQRDLTTLADAARAIDLLPLSSLANQLVVLYEYLADHPPADADDPVFNSLYEAHEAIIDMMDRLAAGQSIQTRHDIESELAELAGVPLAGPADKPSDAPEAQNAVFDAPVEQVEDEPAEEAWFSLKTMDADILDVFLEEASELLESIQRDLDTWREDPDNRKPVADLQRDLHTLKGGARMSEATPVGDLAHELEFLYEGLCNGQLAHSDDLMNLVLQGQDKLSDMVHDLIEKQGCFAAPALIDAIHRARQGLPPEPPAPRDLSAARAQIVPNADDSPLLSLDELDTLDNDILEVFVDEAVELLSELDEAIAQWHEDPTNELAADEMKRVLHTLKGGSRLARLPSMGVLSHELESFIVNAQEQRLPLDDAFFAHVLQQYDQLSIAVEQLQQLAGGEPSMAPAADPDTPPSAPTQGNVVPFQHRGQPENVAEPDVLPEPTPTGSSAGPAAARRAPQETVKVSASLLENLVNLAGETSISRARLEEQVSDMGFTLGELDTTIDRLREKVRQLDMETEAQVLFRQERAEESNYEDFDPLEMDRYTQIQQLSRSLMETASDLIDLRSTLANKSRDAETVLLQQSRIHSELQEGLMQTRMVPFSRLVPRLRRIVRQVATELGKDARFDVVNAEGEMDRSVLERMVSPLEHMLRNAVDHGIETMATREKSGKPQQGNIVLSLTREGGDVVLKLQDDGRGIDVASVRNKAIERGLMNADSDMADDDILQFILSSGFSTAQKVSQISGRGVGMDVVHNEVKALGGTMEISTEQGQGTTFLIRLPFTVSVNRALMVASGDDIYAIPLNTIEGIVRMQPTELREYLEHPDKHYPYGEKQYVIKPLGRLLGNEQEVHVDEISLPQPIILIKGGDRNESVALHIDRLMGSREIVVKTLGPQFATVPAVSGATILGDGSVVVILDVPAMLRSNVTTLIQQKDNASNDTLGSPSANTVTPLPTRKRDVDATITALVVDDSVTVRKVTSRLLTRHGMEVMTAKDGADAMLLLQDHVPDIILLDIEMPRMDGFEVANRVRHTERLQDIPIIMITSRTGQKHKDRALEVGVNEYMGKPFQETQLLDAIQRLVLN